GRELVLVGNNADKLQVYETKQRGGYYKAQRADAYAEVTLKNGKTCRQEFSYGSSYLSHASRTVRLTPDIVRIKVVDFQGVSRILENRVELVNQ
ncbi:hypothetical protein ACFPQ1_24195, partial [Rhodocytophaga aerolata]